MLQAQKQLYEVERAEVKLMLVHFAKSEYKLYVALVVVAVTQKYV